MTVIYTEQLVPASYMEAAPPKLQLYANSSGSVGSAVGSPISGIVTSEPSVWTFDVTSVDIGNYFAQIQDVSDPDSPAFPVRKTASQFYETSPVISATPSAISGICDVLFTVVDNSGIPVQKASVYAMLEPNAAVSGILVASTINSAQTVADGSCTLSLIQYGQFTSGGEYILKVTDRQGKLISIKRCQIPNASSAIAEELVGLDDPSPLVSQTAKQEVLVSGQNIKTINGASILGSGNLSIISESTGVTASQAIYYAIALGGS
jgi:hypothetical protein